MAVPAGTSLPHNALSDRDLCAASTTNADAVEDCPRRVGADEGVEVDSGDVVVQEVVALFQGEVDTDATDQLASAEALAIELSLPNPEQSVDTLAARIDAS